MGGQIAVAAAAEAEEVAVGTALLDAEECTSPAVGSHRHTAHHQEARRILPARVGDHTVHSQAAAGIHRHRGTRRAAARHKGTAVLREVVGLGWGIPGPDPVAVAAGRDAGSGRGRRRMRLD